MATTADHGDPSFSYPCHQHPLQRQVAMTAAFGNHGKKQEDWEAVAKTAEAQMTIYLTTTMVMTAASSYVMTFRIHETDPLSVLSLPRHVWQTLLSWPGTLSHVRLSQLPCVHN
jgi:hypothetical protein